jgi:hypothetical protein
MEDENKKKLTIKELKKMTFGERLIYGMEEILADVKGEKKLKTYKKDFKNTD